MKPKFEPDIDSGVRPPSGARLIDPEAYDASEQRFAASVEENPASARFVVDSIQESPGISILDDSLQVQETQTATGQVGTVAPSSLLQSESAEPPDSNSWRHEVAARVNH